MGWDYALVHLKYTIPPAILLSFVYRPLLTRTDVYKITFLIAIAVTSTIPWDSYLIRHRVWSYPPNAIVGPTLFGIPAEELFFFVIQTYNTSLLYLLLNKATFHPLYLRSEKVGGSRTGWSLCRAVGQLVFGFGIWHGFKSAQSGGVGTYMGLIVIWACPFFLLLWSLAYQFLISLPLTNTIIPILLPTIYLWVVDTIALRRGTWVIESGTKYGLQLWDGLEVEEAVFFLVTNMLIVFGLVAFDNALAVLHTFPDFFPSTETSKGLPSPILLVEALLVPARDYDMEEIKGLAEAVLRLRRKSRSFYLASATFEGRLRLDLIRLYSFCRAADDLVDDAASPSEARVWIDKLRRYIELSYTSQTSKTWSATVREFIRQEFPPETHSALLQLPTSYIAKEPLVDLLNGFEMDLAFSEEATEQGRWPIHTEADLDLYGARVAGTVAELCIQLVFYHTRGTGKSDSDHQQALFRAGVRMGIALQCVNISRDIGVDASISRCYIPASYLDEVGLTPEAIIKDPSGERVEVLRNRLLDHAFAIYSEARGAVEELPPDARAPIRVAVESYMEIGRVLREKGYVVKKGRATVPKWRRVKVAWKALSLG